jgi:K+ transporter
MVTIFAGFMEVVNVPRQLRSKNVVGIVDEKDATYFVASRKFVNPPEGTMNKIERLIFEAMHRNSAQASDFFRLPNSRVITIAVNHD